jgi:hypothetical protein
MGSAKVIIVIIVIGVVDDQWCGRGAEPEREREPQPVAEEAMITIAMAPAVLAPSMVDKLKLRRYSIALQGRAVQW